MAWRKTGVFLATLPSGTKREVMIDGSSVLLLNVGGSVHATEAICPHLGGILADGQLEGSRLKCPEHGATFDARSGQVVVDPDGVEPPQGAVDALRTYPVRVADEQLEVDLLD